MSQKNNLTPKIICLTPVRNESWILEKFLKCASLWADIIIIADQESDDGSREIAKNFEKVKLVDNKSGYFSEAKNIFIYHPLPCLLNRLGPNLD